MAEYTAGDFAGARFADHVVGVTAARTEDLMDTHPWRLGNGAYLSHEEMAENGWRPVREDAPLTLDTLRERWENAEVPTKDNPIRVGDECIMPLDDVWMVGLEGDDWMPSHGDDARILRRAPQPEPWQALAGLIEGIEDSDWTDRPDLLAKMLHERGVRVTGGDDVIERVAHGIHAAHDRGWHFEAEDHAVQDEYREMARAALAAAIRDE